MRIQVRRFTDPWCEPVYRLCEQDGSIADRWLPDEDPEPEGLDAGGFDNRSDADAFRLGVDWIRAEAGLISNVTAGDIDRERDALDGCRVNQVTDRNLNETPEAEPVVEYRRRVA